MIAFGGLNWALDGAAAPVAAVLRLRDGHAARPARCRRSGDRPAAGLPAARDPLPRRRLRLPRHRRARSSTGFDLTIPAGSSLAIVGQNGAGKTTLAKLLCRLYDPQSGAIEVDGVDLRDLDIDGVAGAGWPRCSRTSSASSCRCATTSRPRGAPDDVVLAALAAAGAGDLAELDTVLPRGYDGGTDLSGGQWQRVALARALCAVRLGAGVVLLDEPTAQLDVRGEAEIFERILAATRGLHHDPGLAPVLHRPPRRPHLRGRGRPGRRARHATTS